jgi:hypothetical protein
MQDPFIENEKGLFILIMIGLKFLLLLIID